MSCLGFCFVLFCYVFLLWGEFVHNFLKCHNHSKMFKSLRLLPFYPPPRTVCHFHTNQQKKNPNKTENKNTNKNKNHKHIFNEISFAKWILWLIYIKKILLYTLQLKFKHTQLSIFLLNFWVDTCCIGLYKLVTGCFVLVSTKYMKKGSLHKWIINILKHLEILHYGKHVFPFPYLNFLYFSICCYSLTCQLPPLSRIW